MSNTTTARKKLTKTAKRALIVEDEGEMGLLLNIFLNEREFQLDYVQNLLDAEDYLQKVKPSFVILDNKLPDGFGVDFISYIKKKYPALKIIMISGFGAARDVAIENGADIFLEKPFSKEEFNRSISGILGVS